MQVSRQQLIYSHIWWHTATNKGTEYLNRVDLEQNIEQIKIILSINLDPLPNQKGFFLFFYKSYLYIS